MSGRRDIFEQHAADPEFLERFRKTIADVKAGKLPGAVAAQAFNMSEKSIMRYVARQSKAEIDGASYVAVSSWYKVSGVTEWETWMKGRVTEKAAIRVSQMAAQIWENVWKKKQLKLLTEEDIIDAKLFIKNLSAGSRFQYTYALRTLIRYGFGDQKWLTKHLDTRKLKLPPRMPTELTTEEGLRRTISGVFAGLQALQIPEEEKEQMNMICLSKLSLFARTGDEKEEREIWGTKLNTGKSHLDLIDGKVLSWEFFCKWREVWTIPRAMMPSALVATLENYCAKKGLHRGDRLVTMKKERALAILKAACQHAGIIELRLHDFRKLGLTAACLSGVPLEVAVDFGVGWKDINTARKHYLTVKRLNAVVEYQKMTAFLGLGETAQPIGSENSALPQIQDAQQSHAPAVEQLPRSDANSTDTPAQ